MLLLAVLLVLLALSVVTLLKGKVGLALVGLFVHPCWVVGACRLAKPDSLWAGWFYDEATLRRARARHGGRYPHDGREIEVWRPPAR